VKLLEENLTNRTRRVMRFRKSMAQRTTVYFNTYLSKRGFTGTLQFDHEAETLDLKIQLESMQGKGNQRVVTNSKTLSGGERSYATVALILALWEVMENPFRAMDEFDVFMDVVNRNIAITLLLAECTDKSDNKRAQFIYITPNDASTIQPSPNVKVLKLQPPERGGQTTLNNHLNVINSTN